MGHWRNDKPSIVFKPDEAAVKEVVNARRQQQPVLSIQSLLIDESRQGLAHVSV